MKFVILPSDNGIRFRLSGVDKSIANALRRTLIGNIPILVMKPKDCIITENKTKFTNEIIAARLSAIPICDKDIKNQYTISISSKNVTRDTTYVTSHDFVVKHQGKPISTEKLFPKHPYTQRYIRFLRLKSNMGSPEEIHMECPTSIGTGNECGMYNSVGTCSYEYTHDIDAANEAKSSVTTDKEDWAVLDAKRLYVVKDSFDFVLDTIGIHTNKEVLLLASIVLREQFDYCKMSLDISPSTSTIPDCFDVKMTGSYHHGTNFIKMKGDYSIGKILEYLLFTQVEDITFITFFKLHPHDEFGVLRIAFNDATPESVKQHIIKACDTSIDLFESFSTLVKDTSM
jgi:DNA-directed RNA polymerase subunit L